jgi:hypothetical protein
MTGYDDLRRAMFAVTLPANAPARLAPPSEAGTGTWWQVGEATWVRALPRKSVQVQKLDDTSVAEVCLRADRPGLATDHEQDWVWAEDATKALAAVLLVGIMGHLDASVPALPARAKPTPPDDPQLGWPGGGSGLPDARRRHRLAGSKALSDYLGRVESWAGSGCDPDPHPYGGLAGRLIRHLSAIPRPADMALSLEWDGTNPPVLSWHQKGNPDLLWGASELSFGDLSGLVGTARLSPEDAIERCRLGAWGHLLAMATAVEAATGGLRVPLQLWFCTEGDQPVTAGVTVDSSLWGFEIVRLVRSAAEGYIPETFTFKTLA